MYYRCRRCSEKKELRKSKIAGNPRDKYLTLERSVSESRVLKIKDKGDRSLCPTCLRELANWIQPIA
jgi:hypothetical protein